VLLDRRLYLPKDSWLADRERCAEAGVPEDIWRMLAVVATGA
jgi:hypothetical protein